MLSRWVLLLVLEERKSCVPCACEHTGTFILKEGGSCADQSYGRSLQAFFRCLWYAFSILIRASWRSWKDSLPFQLLVVFEDDNRLAFLNSFFLHGMHFLF